MYYAPMGGSVGDPRYLNNDTMDMMQQEELRRLKRGKPARQDGPDDTPPSRTGWRRVTAWFSRLWFGPTRR
jgi:hypothetical protein